MQSSSKKILDDVRAWITGFVEVPHPLLNGFAPCPYARKARLDHQLDMRVATKATLPAALEDLLAKVQEGHKKVGLLAFEDTADWSVSEARELVLSLREKWRSRDIYFLWDHPLNEERINGVQMNQGRTFLLFVQKMSELREATLDLKKTGYYDCWKESDVTHVMGSRFQDSERGT